MCCLTGTQRLCTVGDENTPLGLLLADDRTAGPVRRMLEANGQAMANGGGDGLMPPDAMAQMLDAMPLRGLVNFGGPQVAEALPALLETLRRAVQS